jgi:hypothetical protein
VRGVYVAGDASRDVRLVAVAIGEGARAGWRSIESFVGGRTRLSLSLIVTVEVRRANGLVVFSASIPSTKRISKIFQMDHR